MSGPDDPAAGPSTRPDPIATRAPAPTPRRLSRRALATLAGVSAIGVAAALGYGLSQSHRTAAPQQSVSIDRRNTDALADAPKDYGDLARTASAGIGAPPAASGPTTTQLADAPPASPGPAGNQAAADRQRRRQQNDSTRASKLFAGTDQGARSTVASSESESPSPVPTASAEATPTGNADAQDRKAAFVRVMRVSLPSTAGGSLLRRAAT